MKFLKSIKARIAALFVGVALVGLAAATSFPPGITVGLNLFPGFWSVPGTAVDVSTDAPVITASGQTISAQLGGANAGWFVATGTTTGAFTFTWPLASSGVHHLCNVKDLTTTADSVTLATITVGTANTTADTTTFTGTIVSGDKLVYSCSAF